jgi:hypothetical protein
MTLIRLKPFVPCLINRIDYKRPADAAPHPVGIHKEIFKFADSARRHDRSEADDPIVHCRNANAVLPREQPQATKRNGVLGRRQREPDLDDRAHATDAAQEQTATVAPLNADGVRLGLDMAVQ